MAELTLGASQSSLLHLQPKLGFPSGTVCSILRLQPCKTISYTSLAVSSDRQGSFRGLIAARVVSSDSKSSTVATKAGDSANEGVDREPEIGGGGDKFGDVSGGGGGGGDGGWGGGSENEGGGEPSDDSRRKMALSMSQKLTLGYAALVGVGGLMGYLKSGSQKSLLAGGVSAAMLYYVYMELPTKPVLASTIGVVLSAALTGVMGSRFLRSRKVFPAGVVSFMSVVMTGGYLHGIMRSLH